MKIGTDVIKLSPFTLKPVRLGKSFLNSKTTLNCNYLFRDFRNSLNEFGCNQNVGYEIGSRSYY